MLHTKLVGWVGSARLAAHDSETGVPALIVWEEAHVMRTGLLALLGLLRHEGLVHEALVHGYRST